MPRVALTPIRMAFDTLTQMARIHGHPNPSFTRVNSLPLDTPPSNPTTPFPHSGFVIPSSFVDLSFVIFTRALTMK